MLCNYLTFGELAILTVDFGKYKAWCCEKRLPNTRVSENKKRKLKIMQIKIAMKIPVVKILQALKLVVITN